MPFSAYLSKHALEFRDGTKVNYLADMDPEEVENLDPERLRQMRKNKSVRRKESFYEHFSTNKQSKQNLLVMVLVWVATSMAYYITNFILKYVDGSIFVNTFASAASDCSSILLANYFYVRFGLKQALFWSYIVAFAGAFLLIWFETTATALVPFFLIIMKFGIGSAFGLIYVANLIFEVQFSSQTLGICNIAARICTLLSPLIVEKEKPFPLVIFCALSLFSGFLITMLQPHRK